jgi:hypothetical protein
MGLHFWSDMKERKVDSRRNHMMIGVVLCLAIISHQYFEIITAGFITIGIMFLLKKLEARQGKTVFGDGDKEIVSWSVPGIVIVFGWQLAGLFIGLLVVSFFILAFLRHWMLINEHKLPGLMILSIAYLIILTIGWLI